MTEPEAFSLEIAKYISFECNANYERTANYEKRLQSEEMTESRNKRIKSETGRSGRIDIIPSTDKVKSIESAAAVGNCVVSARVSDDCDDSDCEVVILDVVHPLALTTPPNATSTSNTKREIQDTFSLDKDDEVEIVGELNITNLPHNRQDCLECRLNTSGGNASFCKLCYCFVCDKLASECRNWVDTSEPENCHKNHCNATDKGKEGIPWKKLRATSKSHQQDQHIHNSAERSDGATSTETNQGEITIENTRPGGVDHGCLFCQRKCQCFNCQQAELRYLQVTQAPSRFGKNAPLHWPPYPGLHPLYRNHRSNSYPFRTADASKQFQVQGPSHPFMHQFEPVTSPLRTNIATHPMQNAPTDYAPLPYHCGGVFPFHRDLNHCVHHIRSNNPLQNEMTSTFHRNNNFPINVSFTQPPHVNGPLSSHPPDNIHYFPYPTFAHPQYFGHRR
ncbi:hypothetical protein ACHAXS_002744 [Conticribra weissflogii]